MVSRRLIRIAAEDSGVTAVEYALMLALIILVCIAGISALGGANQAYWQSSVNAISEAFESQ